MVNKINIETIEKEIYMAYPDICWEKETAINCIRLTYQNVGNKRFPLIVHIHDSEGFFVNLCEYGIVIDRSTDINEVLTAIDDVLRDKIAVAVSYSSEKRFDSQTHFSMSRTFMLKNAEDEAEFNKFIETISAPRTLIDRLTPATFHGIIEVSDWSRGRYYKIYRK